MTSAMESLATALLALVLGFSVMFVTFRAYRRTGNAGFLLIAFALAVLPLMSGVIDQPIHGWIRDRIGDDHSFGDSLRLYIALRRSVIAVLLSAGLLMLSCGKPVSGAAEILER